MKTRWFLRGLGIGIIISALFLCIGYREQSDHNELIKEAKKIGMVFPKEETTSVELAENLNNIQKQEVVSEAAVTTTAETEQEKNSREKIEKSKKDITSASTYQKDNKTVVVLPGEILSSETATRKLEEEGVIDSSVDFDKFLEENGYAKKIRSGKYKIPKNAKYDEIAKIITKQN